MTEVLKPWSRDSGASWWVSSGPLSSAGAGGGISREKTSLCARGQLLGTALQDEGFELYSFLLEQEIYILLPLLFNIVCFRCLRCFFSCGLLFAFSSYSNPYKPGIQLQAQNHSRKDGFGRKKGKSLSYCKTQH